jgi:hypothetical protein
LALKTSQERPLYKGFTTRYTDLMQAIYADQARLSQLSESSQGEKFAEDDILTVFTAHNNALSTEFKSFSRAFEDILSESMAKDCDNNLTCSPPPGSQTDVSCASDVLASAHLDYPKSSSARRTDGFHCIFCFERPDDST